MEGGREGEREGGREGEREGGRNVGQRDESNFESVGESVCGGTGDGSRWYKVAWWPNRGWGSRRVNKPPDTNNQLAQHQEEVWRLK